MKTCFVVFNFLLVLSASAQENIVYHLPSKEILERKHLNILKLITALLFNKPKLFVFECLDY